MAAWLSSPNISHQDLFPHIPSIHLSTVNSSPHPGIAPQILNSSFQPLSLPGDQHLSRVCLAVARIILFSFHLGCHRSAVSLSALNVFPLTQTVACRDLTPASVPPAAKTGPVLLTLLFIPLVPSSYRVLCGSICFFLLVSYSCSLSADVLRVLLCLKVYS